MISLQDLEKFDSQNIHKIYDICPDILKKSYFSNIDEIDLKECPHIGFAGMGGSGTIEDIFSSILSKTNTHVTVIKRYQPVISEEPSSQTSTYVYFSFSFLTIEPISSSLNAGIPIITFNLPFCFNMYI